MKKIVAAFIITVISAAQTFAGGIIFYTSGGSPYVNVVQYETYTAPSAHLSYITVKGGQKTQIQSAGIIANIPLPTTGTEYSLEDIQTNIAQANAMASRQPKYAQAMQKVSQLWTDQIPAAEALQKRRLADEAAAKKKAAEDAEKNRIAKEADDKRLAADVEQKKKAAAEKKLIIEKNKLATDKMQNEYEAKLAALGEKANEIRFVIRRKLDPKNFALIPRFTGDYYEIELDGELAILATTHTKFSSSGVASVFVGASSEKQIKMNDGFEKTVKIYQESNPADVKRLLDCIDQGPKPVVEGGSPSASTSIPGGGKSTKESSNETKLTYTVEENSICITGYPKNESGAVDIPADINGKRVTSIGDEAFQGCETLSAVSIPNSVTSIGKFAFNGCWALTSITIPSSVTTIGDTAFINCDGLTKVTISNGVKSIGKNAFMTCRHLLNVQIPSTVTNIGFNAFVDCPALLSISVDSENAQYSSVDGVLFNKSQTSILKYPEGKEGSSYIIPASVTNIGEFAFSNCKLLTDMTIPSSVTNIDKRAFWKCSKLKNVNFAGIRPKMGADVFLNTQVSISSDAN